MLTPSDRERLTHILDATNRIAEALQGLTHEQFYHDWQKQLVVERLFEIIGEAANHLTDALIARHVTIPWPQIVAMRNLISHEYFRVDPVIIWETAQRAVPLLRQQIQQIVNE